MIPHEIHEHELRELGDERAQCCLLRLRLRALDDPHVTFLGHITGRRRRDPTVHPVHVGAGMQQVLGPAAQPLRVEAGGCEPPHQLRIELRQVAVQAGIRQTGRAAG